MTSDSDEPAQALAAITEIQPRMRDHGAPTDHVIYHLTRARLLRRQSQPDQAGTEVDEALRAGADEPRLLALVATEARRAGRIVRAEQAATTAVSGAPENGDFRKLLAEIQIQRRNGPAALSTLQTLDVADPDVLIMRAEAAILVGTADALNAAASGLDAYVSSTEEPSVEVRALLIRTHARIGDRDDILAQARALATEAPGDPSVSLALGEAALGARDGATAVTALEQAVASSPEDAEAHYLLARARRMRGDAEGSEASFRRAVELTPEHTEARLALGGLLLDMGKYADADALYTELASSARTASGQSVSAAGRLGRVEALIGLGRLDDAQVQLEGVRPADRQSSSSRITAARLAIARERAGDALTELRPLATAEGASATILALYGDALTLANQLEPAGQAYAGALAQDATLPEALIGQGELAVRAEDGAAAIEILGRARRELEERVRPASMGARASMLLGRAQLLERDSATAVTTLRAAAEIEGAPAEVHFWLGEALREEDDAGAEAAYQRYLELAPQGPLAARARRAIR
jgi:Flp pilus assembly protein TadD